MPHGDVTWTSRNQSIAASPNETHPWRRRFLWDPASTRCILCPTNCPLQSPDTPGSLSITLIIILNSAAQKSQCPRSGRSCSLKVANYGSAPFPTSSQLQAEGTKKKIRLRCKAGERMLDPSLERDKRGKVRRKEKRPERSCIA